MLLNVYTLPQLTVKAKIVLLLMVSHVMICGAVPTTRSVLIRNDCSGRFIRVYPNNNTVAAVEDASDNIYANLTIASFYRNETVQIEIYSAVVNKSICFNSKWRLFAMKRHKKPRPSCLFDHKIMGGYDRFSSVLNHNKYMGFNVRGKPISPRNMAKGNNISKHRKRHRHPRTNCFNFLKIDKKFNVNDHNVKFDQLQ